MTLFDLLFFAMMGYLLYAIARGANVRRKVLEREQLENEIGMQAQKEALLAQPYYYYDLVKDSEGGKHYLLYNVQDDGYMGQADTLNGIKKIAKDLHPEFKNVFLKNPATNKISVI